MMISGGGRKEKAKHLILTLEKGKENLRTRSGQAAELSSQSPVVSPVLLPFLSLTN